MSATSDLLNLLHERLGEHLLERLESGEATAAEVGQAVKFLKDNGIEAIPKPHNPLGQLSTSMSNLPFTDPDDVTAH